MSHRRNKATTLRFFAAGVLILFIAAQSLCVIHCATGGGHGDVASSSPCGRDCGSKGAASGPCDPSESPSCTTLKTLFSNGALLALDLPDFYVVSALLPVTLFTDALLTETRVEGIFRQTEWANRVFTPEVYLGPAIRSNAPPFLA
jgi:hypothetical protein